MKLTFISTPGHGYLSVSKKVLEQYIDPKEISGFSGMTFTRVYLEEDSDASKFIQALKDKNIPYEFKESYRESFSITHSYNPDLFDYVPEIGDVIDRKYEIVEIGKSIIVQSILNGGMYKITKSNPFRHINHVQKG